MALKFLKHSSFPQKNCFLTESGYFWKMQVREWAFAQLDLEGVDDTTGVTSNNPNTALGHQEKGERGLKTNTAGKKMTVKFFARAAGFTFIHPFKDDPWIAAEDVRMQVEVLRRRAPSEDKISLTKLEGKTVVIAAPDAKAYEMDTTLTFDTSAVNPVSVFNAVPKGVNHVVISSHGGVPTASDKSNMAKICLFVGGFNLESTRLDTDNVTSAFATLKDKVAENGVIWFGGCNIGANTSFCQKAADASGCAVVAPVMVLPNTKFPKSHVDMLDGFAIPKVFVPVGSPATNISDFCGTQQTRKFVVPV
jgi:hypothetical protein